MKAELLKRLFKAIAYGGCYRTIASSDYLAIDKLTHLVIEEECKKGHTLLADQLENITKQNQNEKPFSNGKTASTTQETKLSQASLTEGLQALPTNKRLNLPLVTIIPREKQRHHMVLPKNIEAF